MPLIKSNDTKGEKPIQDNYKKILQLDIENLTLDTREGAL